ncbi:SDR family NAD(P)-dependent oxidoreductase [Acidobacterium sp. S8]|uniref:SDR family NAD(P)-dependent oxidoreductase n=1 Tax=Acidobacterium sp. S8 TaxID=1641854 RepID=UPI00131A62D7|nr:glucose 1-dehydrogenase [Acidobacterium sp. S8]
MSEELRLVGKKALVTGADTGIGREIAIEFARNGADVVLHYSHHEQGASSAVEEIKALGRKAVAIGADFNDLQQALSLAKGAIAALGAINCLVNNAGVTFNCPYAEMQPAQFDTLFNVNVRAPYFITQKIVADMMRHGGGAICNISSIHGLQGAPEHSAYAATKGAIIAQTRALAVELAHHGIRVNAIAPGWITVENYFSAIPGFSEAEAKKSAFNSVPAARYGVPHDIAALAVLLCGDDASFIVGQTIVVDGGTTALMSLISNFREKSSARFGARYLGKDARE